MQELEHSGLQQQFGATLVAWLAMSFPQVSSAFVGTLIDTPELGVIRVRRDHVVAISSDGIIAHIAPATDPGSKKIIADLSSRDPSAITHLASPGSFLLPTFTDLHLHAPQYLYAGTGLDLPLMEWLDKYAYRAEERIDADPRGLARTVYGRLAQRLKEVGTGCVVCFGTIGVEAKADYLSLVLAEELAKAGIRGFIGKLTMDQSPRPTYGEPSASASLASVQTFLDEMNSLSDRLAPESRGLVLPILTPRFVPTCSDELLCGLSRIAKERGVWVQSHMCESRDQMEWVESTRGKKDETVFDEAGLLDEQTVQAHVTSLPADLIGLVKERGVTLAHCPLSNAYFSDAKFPLREQVPYSPGLPPEDRKLTTCRALDADLKVGLGSDIAGGYSLSIQNAMRQAVVTARHREGDRRETAHAGGKAPLDTGSANLRVDWKEALYVATRGGKKALGMGGCLEVGMEFDAQEIQLLDSASPAGAGLLDLFDVPVSDADTTDEWLLEALERWWCNGDDRNRAAMWIQGHKV